MKLQYGLLLSCVVLVSATWGQTSRPASPKPPMQTGILVVRGDKAASVLIDGKSAGDLEAGGFLQVSAVAGEHFVEAREKDDACKWEKKVTIPAGMQVAEVVDFATACNSRPDANAAPPLAVDPKIQEANELHERGCRLYFLDRASEAVPLLEKAASLTAGIDDDCLKHAQSSLTSAQIVVGDCENSQASSEPGKKADQANVAQPDCRLQRAIYGTALGDLGGFSYLNYFIQEEEHSLPASFIKPETYGQRAMYEYALGNPTDALRDLQTELDGARRYWANRSGARVQVQETVIGITESKAYLQRAVIQTSIGNDEAAGQDCRMALASRDFTGKSEREFCTRLAAAPAAPGSGRPGGTASSLAAPQASPVQPSISQEIETVRSGVYSPLPPIQSSGAPCRSSTCPFQVKNDTSYNLTVLFGGPTERRVEVAPGGSVSTDLQSGSYKIVGRVNAANVTPSYGDYVLDATSAGIEFYIAARP
jgi:hypothetical protein